MKIVVPTDFSVCSKIAVQFAVAFARQVQAELILLHVLPSLGPTAGRMPTNFLKEQMLEWTEKEFSQLEAEIQADGLQVTQQVAYGAAVEKVMESFTQIHVIDLIIMGSKGASGLKKILLGSNTVGVINNCSTPVIVVPEHVAIAAITHLVYASDLKHLMEEVKSLLPFARLLQAAIKIIHMPPLQYLEHLDTERLIQALRKESAYEQIEVELIEGEDIVNAIEHYAAASNGEILAMFTHRCSFLEQLFSQSITREIAWHNRVPLLVINNRQ
jgi:nucleotide-binding universal stress UspA family protein